MRFIIKLNLSYMIKTQKHIVGRFVYFKLNVKKILQINNLIVKKKNFVKFFSRVMTLRPMKKLLTYPSPVSL